MVDAIIAARVSPGSPTSTPMKSETSLGFHIGTLTDRVDGYYSELAARGVFAPPQSPAWIETWIAATKPDVVSVVALEGSRPVFALALEVVQRNGYRVAQFMGGTHANGNFALADPEWLERAKPSDFKRLASSISRVRPDIDVVSLLRLLPRFGQMTNPLLSLRTAKNPNVALAVNLDGGFDRIVAGPSGKRKCKKHRTQARKYEAVGAFQRIEANSPHEVDRLLDAFFEMKVARFRKAGIANVFADSEVQTFFRSLFIGALAQSPKPFVLHGLCVAGKLRAVTGSSVSGDRLVCEFGSIAEDELWNASPGEYLFFENIQDACEQGFAIYDFSIGDEAYKRLWSDIEVELFDLLLPLTLKGRIAVGGLALISKLKSRIKNNPTIWRYVKLLREITARSRHGDKGISQQD